MDVSVIIVNYNTCELVLQCLRSIYEMTSEVEIEVIVVDNSSSDDSVSSIRKNFPQVNLLEASENLGFGKANNWGATEAKGKYLFLLNSDTILLNNAIKLLFQFAEKEYLLRKIGVIGGVLLDDKFNETGSWGELPSILNTLLTCLKLTPRFSILNKNKRIEFKQKGSVEVGYITGADMFLAKKRFDDEGGFDVNFFMYYEETDLQKRMARGGYKQLLIEGPRVVHLEGKSFKAKVSNKKRMMQTESMFYYFKKHDSCLLYLLFRLSMVLLRIWTIFDSRYPFRERWAYFKMLIS